MVKNTTALRPRSKKAQGNTFWIIIGAVIALVVLIVILLIFTGKSTTLERGLLDCDSKGGECVNAGTCKSVEKGTLATAFECSGDNHGKECCFVPQDSQS
jgi:hypothetical protein